MDNFNKNSKYWKFQKERLDPISPTFCAAAWLWLSMDIRKGTSASCCYPPPDKINLDDVKENVLSIHNTIEKIEQRRSLLSGDQTPKCNSCWIIENDNEKNLSQRITLSEYFSDQDFTQLNLDNDVVPQLINLNFSNLCNFSCSYCDATQSSSWAADLYRNGPYKLNTDKKMKYSSLGMKDLLNKKEQAFLLDKAKEMIFDNLPGIKKITVSGGEPTIIPIFWDFFEELIKFKVEHLKFDIITNASSYDRLNKIIENSDKFEEVSVSISGDTMGKLSEFVRHGLIWKNYEDTVISILSNSQVKVNFLITASCLTIDGILEYLDWLSKLNNDYPNRLMWRISPVIYPEFQSMSVLPDNLKQKYIKNIKKWIQDNPGAQELDSRQTLARCIPYLNIIPENQIEKIEDLKSFVRDYAQRRNLTISEVFSSHMVNFLEE